MGTALSGGEGIFLAHYTGLGRATLQTMAQWRQGGTRYLEIASDGGPRRVSHTTPSHFQIAVSRVLWLSIASFMPGRFSSVRFLAPQQGCFV